MVPGVPPREASDRLFIYQNQFDALYRKFVTYTGGEELFGLPVTDYPELLQIRLDLIFFCSKVKSNVLKKKTLLLEKNLTCYKSFMVFTTTLSIR